MVSFTLPFQVVAFVTLALSPAVIHHSSMLVRYVELGKEMTQEKAGVGRQYGGSSERGQVAERPLLPIKHLRRETIVC